MDLGDDFGKKLALLRVSRDWKQSTLARKAGITPSSLSLYESGKTMPDLATLFRLLATLGYRLGDLDAAGDFLATLRLSRGGIAQAAVSPAPRVDGIAALAEAVARLGEVRPAAELVRVAAAEEGFPLPEDRARAEEGWERLRKYPHAVRRALVAELRDLQVWSLCELLCEESATAGSEDAAAALDLARLALEVADRAPGAEAWFSRLHGYARGFLSNAERVGGDLPAAQQARALADQEWEAGAGCPGDLLSEARFLDLKSSLRRAQRLLPEALDLIDRALALSGPEMKGRLLTKRSKILEERDELDDAIAHLREAEPFVDPKRDPRLWLCLRHNTLWCLTTAGRHEEAEALLPEVKALSGRLGKELDRVRLRWAEGRIAAGRGRTQQGIDLLSKVRADFVGHGIGYDAALVTIELASVFLKEGNTGMVKTLAFHLKQVFKLQGVHREALAALTLFQKAAERDKATLELARSLADYLRKARHDPDLKFRALPIC